MINAVLGPPTDPSRRGTNMQCQWSACIPSSPSHGCGPSSFIHSFQYTITEHLLSRYKELTCQRSRCKRHEFNSIPWRRKWQPTPLFLPRESHGQKTLAVYSP